MNLKIREAIGNDYTDISSLVVEVHNLHVKNRPDVYLGVDNLFPKERFEDLLNSDNIRLFVVEDTDSKELVAYSIIEIMAPRNISILIQSKYAYIDDFCVKHNYQKKGIGKLLFNHIVDYSKTEGASNIQLTVWEFNKNAIMFYESLGMSTRNRRMELNL